MAEVTYEIIGLRTAKERGLPFPDYTSMEDDWNSGIWRCENGTPVEYVGDDMCEPEDAILRRDWRWVATALQAAYDLGRAARGEPQLTDRQLVTVEGLRIWGSDCCACGNATAGSQKCDVCGKSKYTVPLYVVDHDEDVATALAEKEIR